MKKISSSIYITAFGVFFAVFCLSYAYPYHLIPASGFEVFVNARDLTHQPFYLATMRLISIIWRSVSDDFRQALIFHSVFWSGVAVSMVGLVISLFVRQKRYAFLGMGLFGLSGWQFHYHFYHSYAPLAAALNLLVYYFMLRAYFEPHQDSIRMTLPGTRMIFCSGVFSGLLLLSASISPYEETFHLALLIGLGVIKKRGMIFRTLFAYSLPITVMAVLYAITFEHRYISEWLRHITDNIHTAHYYDAEQRFKYIPRVPLFSFFGTAAVYDPLSLVGYAATSAGGVYLMVRKKTGKHTVGIALALCGIILAHALILDGLPFTKVARNHYPIFPLVFIAFALMMHEWLRYCRPDLKKASLIGMAVYVVFSLAVNAYNVMDMKYHKQTAPREMSRISNTSRIFIFKDDPHSNALKFYLNLRTIYAAPPVEEIRLSNRVLNRYDANSGQPALRALLLCGPHGPKSGMSIARHSVMPDFEIDSRMRRRPAGVIEYKWPIPYYHPSVLMEEEVSQALYLRGESPDYKREDLMLTAWAWQ
jgi:hypothetical protein